MTVNYTADVMKRYYPEPSELVMDSLFQQYERVLVESLIASFGLDFLVNDQLGGDVDTIHNVQQIGRDSQMIYKNAQNQQAYEQRGEYKKSQYDSDRRFIEQRAELSRQKKEGTLSDAYTGQKFARNANMQVDHVIATKEIHDDRGRVLAELSGLDLANSKENLQPTDRSINCSMQEKSIDEYCAWLKKEEPQRTAELEWLQSKPQSELTDKERATLHKDEQQAAVNAGKMKRFDAAARKSYNAKLKWAYYTSPQFVGDLALAAGNVGGRMGVRQALGFVFAEMWFAVKEEFKKLKNEPFELGVFLKNIGNGLKKGFERAKEKYRELFSRFLSGAAAGTLSSLTTTLCNIFFTTTKNVGRLIRQSYAFLVQASEVLFINPQNYTFGERMRTVAKILATGASVVVGHLVSNAVENIGIKTICDIVPSFCGAFVTGIMSCTLLYFLDRSELMNKLIKTLDRLHTIETEIQYYRQQAEYFERYAAQLENINLAQLKKEITFYNNIAQTLEAAQSENELNAALKNAYKNAGILIPWGEGQSFSEFMQNKNNRLVFR